LILFQMRRKPGGRIGAKVALHLFLEAGTKKKWNEINLIKKALLGKGAKLKYDRQKRNHDRGGAVHVAKRGADERLGNKTWGQSCTARPSQPNSIERENTQNATLLSNGPIMGGGARKLLCLVGE